MAESLSLMEFLRELVSNVQLRDWFADDPEAALREYGLDDLSPADVHDALVLIEDNQTADFSRDYNTGSNDVQLASVPAVHHSGGDDHKAAIEYLNTFITDNYVDERDTIVDSSLNQQVDTDGGDFDQEVDIDHVSVSGDGAVGAGGDIDGSTIVSGDGNQVGDGNVDGNGNVVGDGNQAVTGHDNNTSFGDGDANSTEVDGDLTVGDGGAFASGGNASVDNSDNSLENVGNDYSDNSLENVGNDYSDNSLDNVGNDYSDNSDNSDNSVEDSDNDNSDNSDHSDNSQHNVGNFLHH